MKKKKAISKKDLNKVKLRQFMDRYNLTESEAIRKIAELQNTTVAPLVVGTTGTIPKSKRYT